MSTAVDERPATYEEERGKPMPSLHHSLVQSRLLLELSKTPAYFALSELTLEFNGKPYTPDICVYPREDIDWQHDEVRRSVPPLLAVEIFSPMQGSKEVMDKVDVYLQNGVKSCWVVSPPLKTLAVYRAGQVSVSHTSGIVTDEATGLAADLAAVFA
ncbi:MAG: Uma2 family endonuclease [Verrucomicrobiales bacterium]